MAFQHDHKIFTQTLNAETKTKKQTIVDRSFELPKGLYIATVAIYMAYLVLMWSAFQAGHMAVIMSICIISVGAGFGVPALWALMKPDHDHSNMSWQQFVRNGIETHTGILKAKDATIQMMILPVLILMWGVAVVIIASFV